MEHPPRTSARRSPPLEGPVVVWGLGRFGGGIGAALHVHRSGGTLRIVDRAPPSELEPSLRRLSDLGGPQNPSILPEHPASLDEATLLVVNPGVRPDHPLLEEACARGLPCTQELDLFLDAYPGQVVAVTGTNGKSTTAAMLAAALRHGLPRPRSVLLGGNIGTSLLLEPHQWRAEQWAVIEVSSFQAERLRAGRDRLAHAVFTRITRDHLDWHGSLARYRAAKLRLLAAVRPTGRVLGLDRCPVLREALSRGEAGSGPLPGLLGLASDLPHPTEAGSVVLGGRELLAADDLPLAGRFNAENAALALAAALVVGVDPEAAIRGIRSFRGLPHRLRDLGRRAGVLFVDNGVSTVAETSLQGVLAVRSRGPVRWVCGGHPKERDLSAHAEIAALAASVHVFGEIAPRLGALLRARPGRPPAVSVHSSLRQALDGAWDCAGAGDVLLLSPGFSSHDQYPNFAARSDDAIAWWNEIERSPGGKALGTGES